MNSEDCVFNIMLKCLTKKLYDFITYFLGVYHRYDGVVRDNPSKYQNKWQQIKGFFGFEDFRKILSSDFELSGKVFQPQWQVKSFNADGINGEELITYLNCVVSGLREVYCRQASLWYASDFHKIVGSMVSQ